MKKSFNVDSTFNDMRIDRWIRNNLGNYPQGLIEKSLKSGKVKINSKKIKSSHKVKTGDIIDLFNFDFKETIVQKTIKFVPSEDIIKENEDLIIDNNFINNTYENKKILFEGAQGAMLDLDYGSYPFVTSSNTISSYIPIGSAINKSYETLGIFKAYATRVGNGPFPSEL